MIIPVRCFTCGKVIADKWQEYERRVQKELDQSTDKKSTKQGPSMSDDIVLNAFRGKILDDLGLTRLCCRRHMLTHVDLCDLI